MDLLDWYLITTVCAIWGFIIYSEIVGNGVIAEIFGKDKQDDSSKEN